MNKNDLRYIKTEELIIKSFIDCINETSFEETTVLKVCEKARISRHSFYTHYTDKYELLDKLYHDLELRLNNSINIDLLLYAKNKDFYPSCKRAVTDFINNKDLLIPLLKCSRNRVMNIFENFYIDIPTSLFIKDYNFKMQNPKLQLTKRFLLNGLLGYLEDYLHLNLKIDEDTLIKHLHNLCNESSSYFIEQLTEEL